MRQQTERSRTTTMLNCILGGCGTGKSTRLMERMVQDIAAGRTVLVLVPEQFSFEEEKRLYRAMGAQAFNRLQTCSFATLSRSIFKECGENLRTAAYAGDQEKLVFLYQAVRSVAARGDLQALQRRSDSADFIDRMLSLIVKLRKAGVTSEKLHDAAAALPDRLREKTADIAVILLEYERILREHNLYDSLTDLSEAALRADVHGYFKGKSIYIDEFDSFTGDQYAMLDVMLSQAESITAAIRTDEPDAKLSPIFEGGNRTYRALVRMAQEKRLPVQSERCTEFLRTFHPDLCAVSSQILRPVTRPADYAGHVHIIETTDPTAEAEYICATIVKQLSEDSSLHCRDIAVAVKSLSAYGSVLEHAMQRYELPYHISFPSPVQYTELMRYVLSLLAVLARETLDTQDLLRLMKNPFFGYSAVDVSMLEHFCFTWGIDGQDWLTPFWDAQSGCTERAEPFGGEVLEQTRLDVTERIAALRSACVGQDVRTICTALCVHLNDRQAENAAYLDGLDTLRRREFTTVWNMLMDILDTIVSSCGGQKMELFEFAELLGMLISNTTFAVPPQTLDSVQIVEAQTARLSSPSIVFVMGVNEGVFPGDIQLGGMFTRQELEELEKQDIVISRMFFELYSDERLVIHKLFSAPAHQLYLTCPAINTAGERVHPSMVIRQIQAMFAGAPELTVAADALPISYFVRTPASAYFHFVRALRTDDPSLPAIRQILEEHPLYASRMQKLTTLTGLSDHHVSSDRMKRLLGSRLTFSPSGIEDFYKCPFWYFLRRCLRLYVPEENRFSDANAGNFAHYCLEQILRKYDMAAFTALTADELLAEIRGLSAQFSADNFSDAVRRDGRFQFNYRMSGMGLLQVLQHMQNEMRSGTFVPVGFEVVVHDEAHEGTVPPYTLRDGKVRCIGKIDRVDVSMNENESYLRVVDYKTGERAFAPEKLARGLDMQMLIYLFALEQSGLYPSAQSGGVLYMPSGQPEQKHYSERDEQTAPEDVLNDYYHMKGLLLEAAAPLMEPEVQEGYTPVLDAQNSKLFSVDAEQMVKLREHVERKICEMADALQNGDISPDPYLNLPCSYCGCSDLCGRECQKPESMNKAQKQAAIAEVFGEETTETEEMGE
ncbi:MAG: hypothetical protein E7502_00265 [Ruminococcus sp.]|nr:hypothetical protein [Ruminococcus sp.]